MRTLGSGAVRLLVVSWALFAVFFKLVASTQRGGDTFSSIPWLSGTILAAGVAAVTAGGIGAAAVTMEHDRSVWVPAANAFGAIALPWTNGEIVFPH